MSVSPSASCAVGLNEYARPATTLVTGVPLMTGALFAADTVIVNAGSDTETLPSLTLITMLRNVPTSAGAGVPLSVPFAVLKLAHDGLPWML